MKTFRAALLMLLMGSMPVVAQQAHSSRPDLHELMRPVDALVKALNDRADFPSQLFSAGAVVIDEFGRFEWSGDGSAKTWYDEVVQPLKKPGNAFSDLHVTVQPPQKPRVDSKRAYFTVPAAYDYRLKGKPGHQQGRWTFVLEKQSGHWVILAHSWDVISDTLD